MFDHAMVATDLSVDSDKLIDGLAGLARWGIHRIDLVHASPFVFHEVSSGTTESRQVIREDRERRRTGRMADQQRRLEELGFAVSSHQVTGCPEEAIPKLAEKLEVDLIVVGIRKTSLARNIALGSTALEILRASEVPVLLVQPEVGVSAENDPVGVGEREQEGRILFATDFSASANEAYVIVCGLARSRQAAVTVFHSAAGGTGPPPGVLEHLGKLADGIRKTGSEVEVMVGAGDPTIEICAACGGTDASLVVMGTHGKGVIGEFFVGSVSQAVARRVEIPVLLVRGTREVRWKSTGLSWGKGRSQLRGPMKLPEVEMWPE